MKLHELKCFPLSRLDLLSVPSCQAVFSFGNLVKLKCHAGLLEFLRHQLRLFEGHIRVRCTMEQHGRRIGCGDISNRHERVELLGFPARIPSGDSFWPLTGLAAEIVEDAAVTFPLPGIGHCRAAHLLPGFFGGDLSLVVAWMRTWRWITNAPQIALAGKSEEHAPTQ